MQKIKRKSDSSVEATVEKKSKEATQEKPAKKKFSKPDKPKPSSKPLPKDVSGKKPFGKPQNDKFSKKPAANGATNFNGQTKPQDWNEYKKKIKVVRQKRKEGKNQYEIITQAKQIGEKLRVKKIEKAERTKLVNELHELLGNKGGYVKFVLAHDMARIVQHMLKFGNPNVREDISNELIPSTVIMLQSKYGKFCVKRLLKYTNSTFRHRCIETMYGNAVKLTSHAISAPVFEYAYSTYATPLHKVNLIQEFFGDMYKQSKEPSVKHLRDVYKDSPDMKAAALSATKANLSRILNKDLLDSGLVQTVLCQFLAECSADDKAEMITQLAPHIVVISNSRDGARAAMQCIWHGTNKDRKVAMKALKEHAVELCKHEHGHCMIIALLDCIDDTVLLQKMILGDILSKAAELIADDWGRKVLTWLVHPGDTAHFHPTFMTELEAGRKSSSCKKDIDVRRKELHSYSSGILITAIAEEPKAWLDQASKAVITLSILKSGSGVDLQNALKAISTLLMDIEWKIENDKEEMCAIEHPGLHMTLKKLAQNDKKLAENGEDTFGMAIVEQLTKDVIKSWIKLNRGCFFLVAIYENNGDKVQERLQEVLRKHLKLLDKQTCKGAQILGKKLV